MVYIVEAGRLAGEAGPSTSLNTGARCEKPGMNSYFGVGNFRTFGKRAKILIFITIR
jgi:hypothetical protein